ncbi:MAG: hypothetical protein R3C54_01625 [Parvularculaceae bacterium]
MEIQETNDYFARIAEAKAKRLKKSPARFFVSSMMAGAYVGIGIILILSVGEGVDPGLRPPLVMQGYRI